MRSSSPVADLRRSYQTARDNYLLVFILILFVIGLTAAVETAGAAGGLGSTIIQSLALLMTLRNANVEGRGLRLARILAALPVLAVIASALLGRAVGPVYYLSSVALILGTQSAIVVHALRRGRVTGDTVMGALCVYLLLGLLFATVDAFYASAVSAFFVQPAPHPGADYVYFSFITLGTVGYGDLTPAPGAPRMLALAEGLLGQLYLVTVISVLVGNLGRTRVMGERPERREEKP